jgi:hypothetical protein
MGRKTMTEESARQRIFDNSNGKYILVSIFKNKRSKITIRCTAHNTEWTAIAENSLRTDRPCGCKICAKERKSIPKTAQIVVCSYCNISFLRTPSKIRDSKNSLFFCCRKHKDLAQRKEFGMKQLWSSSWLETNGIGTYRRRAFEFYGETCEECGYNVNKVLIDIHHIDNNRENNLIENLIPLCVMCHAKVTRNIVKIQDRKLIPYSR